MKTRQLQTGQEAQELEKPITLTVYTKCPEKWMLIDLETGERYIGHPTEGKNSWKKVNTCPTLT
jgi:hypothetical protein